MTRIPGEPVEDTPNGRSGCCYEETFPRQHELCPGQYNYRATPNASTEVRVCSCRCHVVGPYQMGMPTLRKLLDDLGRDVMTRGGRPTHGNWKGPQYRRSLRAGSRPLQ